MSYEFYKIMHFSGIFLMLLALGSIASHCISGGTKDDFKNRKFMGRFHSLGSLLALVGGFGLMAKAGFNFTENSWLWAKTLIWLALGLYPIFYYKVKVSAKLLLSIMLCLVFCAIYVVVVKPF